VPEGAELEGNAQPVDDLGDESGRRAEATHRLVVVPVRPGPLRPLDHRSGGSRDDLDEMIDEVFGPTTDERPGAFDAALLVLGLVLLTWGWFGGTGLAVAIGICLVVLGTALPARSFVQAAGARRAAQRQKAILRTGHALDVSDPTVRALANAYADLLAAAVPPGVAVGSPAIEAGHAALLEVASLLDGRAPLTADERAYVDQRTHAIRDLSARLGAASRTRARRLAHGEPDPSEDARVRASAVVRARQELESTTGVSSIDEIERLRTQLDDPESRQ
jgi:hypothetical protein